MGDRITDLIAGSRSGILNLIHVETGHGKKERKSVLRFFSDSEKNNILYTADDLSHLPLNNLIYSVV